MKMRKSKKAVKLDLNSAEQQVKKVLDQVTFIYGGISDTDEQTIRAMIVHGASPAQITESLTIAAVNPRVDREDKMRYAFGCLRNIMLEGDAA